VSAVAGTSRLTGFALRVDRRRSLAWALSCGGFVVVVGIAFNRLYPTAKSRAALAPLANSAVLRAILGPLYDASTTGGLIAWRMGSIISIILGLATTFLVVARTRGEEQRGRGALLAAAPVGRGAATLSGLLDAAAMDAAAAAVVAVALLALAQRPLDSVLFALSIGLCAWCFGSIAALIAQVAATSKAANGIAAGVIALAFLVRAVGELVSSPWVSWIAWLSPIAWVERLRAFDALDPATLLLSLVVGVVGGAVAVRIASGREHGRGLLVERTAVSRRLGRGPLGLAWRLEHVAITVTMVAGFAYAVLAGSIVGLFDSFVKSSPVFEHEIERLGGTHVLKDAFTTTMAIYGGVAMAAWAVSLVLRLHSEETRGRVTVLAAAGAPRRAIIDGYCATALFAGVVGTVAWGLGLGVGRLVVDRTPGALAKGIEAGLVCVPAVIAVIAVAVLAVGATRRAGVLAWGAVVWCAMVSVLGPFLGLPHWVVDLSPFTHVPPLPLAGTFWVRGLLVLAAAAAMWSLGRASFVRRELGGA